MASITNNGIVPSVAMLAQATDNSYKYGKFMVACFPLIISFISPLLAWIFAMLILAIGSSVLNRTHRRILGLVVIFAGALTIASRQVFVSPSDDFIRYYADYQSLSDGNMETIFYYGDGFEIGLQFLLLALTFFFPKAEPSLVIFFVSLFCGLLFLSWLEKYGMKEVEPAKRSLCLATALIFFSFYMTSQGMKQMIAMLLVLYALYEKNILISTLFVVMGTAFHLTALPIYIVSTMSFKYPVRTLLMVSITALIFVNYFTNIVSLYSEGSLSYIGTGKLLYYTSNIESFTKADLSLLKYFVFLIVIYLVVPVRDNVKAKWRYFVLTFSAIYFVFLPLPGAALRITVILNSILLGYLIFHGLKKYSKVLTVGVIMFIFYRSTRQFIGDEIGFDLWNAYDWIGIPFYYWIK
jgi:hypothetical protein